MKSMICRLFVVVLDAKLFLHLAVVEDAEDVLAGAVDGAAQQEVGEAEVVVLTSQHVVAVLRENYGMLNSNN